MYTRCDAETRQFGFGEVLRQEGKNSRGVVTHSVSTSPGHLPVQDGEYGLNSRYK